jgi:hypothetical protein
MSFTKYGLIPTVSGGSVTTYYADGLVFDNTKVAYAAVADCCWTKSNIVGAFSSHLAAEVSLKGSSLAASISCKPLAPIEEVE